MRPLLDLVAPRPLTRVLLTAHRQFSRAAVAVARSRLAALLILEATRRHLRRARPVVPREGDALQCGGREHLQANARPQAEDTVASPLQRAKGDGSTERRPDRLYGRVRTRVGAAALGHGGVAVRVRRGRT